MLLKLTHIIVFLTISFIFMIDYLNAAVHTLTEAMGEEVTMGDFSPTLAPGDTVIISPSRTTIIKLNYIVGSPGSWITFTNPSNAKITITSPEGDYGSMRIYNSRYVRLLGNNYSSETYGIKLVGGNGCLAVVNTRDVEAAYIEMTGSKYTGIGMGQCWAPWTCTEEMENVSFHDNYIHDVGTEGMYLGKSSRAVAPKFVDIQVYNNIIENCGWDGLQVGQTLGDNNNVYNNIIRNTGIGGSYVYCGNLGYETDETCPGQWFGIIVNPEHYNVNVYQNYIQNSYYTGIAIHSDADGPVFIHDNVVWDAGGNGVGVGSSVGSSEVINNTIISSGARGIETDGGDTTGEIRYNLLVANVSGINSSYSIQNDNRVQSSTSTEYFVNAAGGNFRLTIQSPARDAGVGSGYSTVDYDGYTRPYGDTDPDIGAFEFFSPYPTILPPTNFRLSY